MVKLIDRLTELSDNDLTAIIINADLIISLNESSEVKKCRDKANEIMAQRKIAG